MVKDSTNKIPDEEEIIFSQKSISIGCFFSIYSRQVSPVTPPRPFIKGQYSGTSFVERKIEETTNPKGIKIVRLNRALIVPLMIIR